MGTISTAIQLHDRVTAPINNIISAIENVCNAFDSVESSMDGGFDARAIDSARAALSEAVLEADRLGDEIAQNAQLQDNFNTEVQEGVNAADGLSNSIMGMVGAYASFQGVQKLVKLSDDYIQTSARLGMINDGLQTQEELQDKIYASAQRSRASYTATADAVAKLGLNAGDAFSSTDEIIAFSEQLNKQFVIAGTETTAMQGAMTQLVQALGAGALRGDELNSIFEAAPNLIQTIADYMEVPLGSIKELASEGAVTAEIVKNAMLSAAEETNAKFEQMPMTWGQVWTGVMNELYMASIPVLKMISSLAQNWSILKPIAVGLAVAVGMYTTALLYNIAVTKMSELTKKVHAAAQMMETGATFAATAAQHGFNAALLACPLTWIILLIIAVIATLYAVVAAINKVTGKTISATGIIVGALAVAGAFIGNIFIALINFAIDAFVILWNFIGSFVNFFANVFTDPVGAIARLFFDLVDTVLNLLESLARGIDAVFGSNLAGAVSGWRNDLSGWVDNKFGKGVEVFEKLDASEMHLGRFEYGDAYKAGYEWGANLGKSKEEDTLEEVLNNAESVNEIAENTDEMAGALSDTADELKYLRDIAEREIINRFTTAEIHIEQTNNNNISSDMDIDGIMNKWNSDFEEILVTAAEGVHA